MVDVVQMRSSLGNLSSALSKINAQNGDAQGAKRKDAGRLDADMPEAKAQAGEKHPSTRFSFLVNLFNGF